MITTSLRQQRGIATILMVVLIGIALIATSLSAMYSVRSTQEKQVAVHAVTHAQTGLWTGVEAFRRYLESIDTVSLKALHNNTGFDITLPTDAYGSMSVSNITVASVGDVHTVTTIVKNKHEAAQSSAAVKVVFEVNSSACANCTELSASLDFYDDLEAKGEVNFTVATNGVQPPVNVDGNVKMLTIGDLSNFETLNATGVIELGSGIELKNVHSNEGVKITGSVRIESVTSAGYVETSSGGGAGEIYANGYVDLNGSPETGANQRPIDDVHSLSTIAVRSGGYDLLRAKDDITFYNSVTLSAIEARSAANVNIANSTGVEHTVAGGQLFCNTSQPWTTFLSVTTNGALDSTCSHLQVPGTGTGTNTPPLYRAGVAVNQNNTIEMMDPVAEFMMPGLVVDVYTLKAQANYVVEQVTVNNVVRTKITVQNVKGADPNVTHYYLGDYDNAHVDFFCTGFGSKGKCNAPSTPGMSACIGDNVYTSCLTHTPDTSTWSFTNGSMAPGIWWFDGNVSLGSKTNYVSVLATGNVVTAGEFRGKAVNWAGYNEVCAAQGTGTGVDPLSDFTDRYSRQYPTNLCDKDSTPVDYTPQAAGNIVIAAGGKNPDTNTYVGGNITIAANIELWGSVLAGDVLTTGGQNIVHGHVAAAAQVTKGAGNNELGGNTTIDLTSFPDDFKPNIVPNMDVPCAGGCPAPGFGAESKLLWSKYL